MINYCGYIKIIINIEKNKCKFKYKIYRLDFKTLKNCKKFFEDSLPVLTKHF